MSRLEHFDSYCNSTHRPYDLPENVGSELMSTPVLFVTYWIDSTDPVRITGIPQKRSNR